MYDSRTDNDALRMGHKHDSLRTWNEWPWADMERRADRIKALHHDNVWANRANAEHGWGDQIEYGTPKARRLATPKAERDAIAEGLAEWHADLDERAEADLILDEHATFTNWLPGEYGDLTLWAVWHDQRCYGC